MPKKLDLKPVLKAVNPAEAIAFFRQKGYRIGFDYRDVWQQEHQAAFTVAKAMQLDLLTEIRSFVDAAIADGSTLATFQKELMPRLAKRGWWGKAEMLDPVDGEKKLVQLGSPRRLETIFDTNMATAYSEGQWERIQRNKELFPFLEYVRSASTNPRHTHLAYAGLVLPADDSFWQSHLPIKEWGCKCSVIQYSQRMLDREGLKVGKAPPEVMRTVVNKRTGEVMRVPTGVDPAFNYPPGGRRAQLDKLLKDKLAAQPPGAVAAASVSFARQALTPAGKAAGAQVHRYGLVPAAARVKEATGLDLSDHKLVLTGDAVRHVVKHHGNAAKERARGQLPVAPADFQLLPALVGAADEIAAAGLSPDGLPVIQTNKSVDGVKYIAFWELRAKRQHMALVTLYKKMGGSK
jgi:hypothetical protein